MEVSKRIKELAAEAGFPLAGLAAVPADGTSPGGERFASWLARGLHGPLSYLAAKAEARTNPGRRFPWARSVLCVGAFYDARPAGTPGRDLIAHVARYARGPDYHRVFTRRLKKLARTLVAEGLCGRAHFYVDTGPVLERAWAAQAGLGFIGKNTCLIHPRQGSFLLLGEVLLDAAVEPDRPMADHCGTCRRCMKACPTGALIEPRVLDARLCLATWTLEQKGQVPPALRPAATAYAAGCDICQEVCPFNALRRRPEPDAELSRPMPWHAMTLAQTAAMDRETYDRCFRGSVLRRTGLEGLRTLSD